MKSFSIGSNTIFYVGPDLEQGALPAVFYFALAGEESLGLDPYNQPVKALIQSPLRVFSLSIPEHNLELSPLQGLERWAHKMKQGRNIIADFCKTVAHSIEELVEKGWIIPKKVGIAGLSRGGFIACHIAALSPHIENIVGFAPVTSLKGTKEFSSFKDDPLIHSLDLQHLCPLLINKHLHFYMGNRDVRVSTAQCFHFIQQLTEANFEHNLRSPPVELTIYPSIGHHGHGTPPEIFHNGAEWLAKKLL
jgi:esterase FrsA